MKSWHSIAYGDKRLWTDETRRARWDGAASLLAWWHEQDEVARPPLNNLSKEDAQDFIASLEQRGLARSTIRGYRSGASALTKALNAMRTLPVKFDPTPPAVNKATLGGVSCIRMSRRSVSAASRRT